MPVRCSAPNRCRYCGQLTAIENATVLRIDGELGPRMADVGITLTTHRPVSDVELRDATAVFWRAFRRRWGSVDYCGFVEWTTGKSARSGGRRRTHVHYLVKGLDPAHDRAEVEAWVRVEWKSLVGAWVVECRQLRTPAGAIAYLALHHQKQEQGPPAGWSGKRFRPSKGYFNRPIGELRELARARHHALRLARKEEGEIWANPDFRTVYEPRRPRVVQVGEDDATAASSGPGSWSGWPELVKRLADPEAPANRPVSDADVVAWRDQERRRIALASRDRWRGLTEDEREARRALAAPSAGRR